MQNILVYDIEADELEKLADEFDTSIAEIVSMLMDYAEEMKKDNGLVSKVDVEVEDESNEPSKDIENDAADSMDAKVLDIMVKAMRTKYNRFESRTDVTEPLLCLYNGLHAIHRDDLANELIKLYEEIESVETNDIVRIGTFRKE